MLGRRGLPPAAATRVTVAVSHFVVGWALRSRPTTRTGAAPPSADVYPLIAAALSEFDRADPDHTLATWLTGIAHGLVHNR